MCDKKNKTPINKVAAVCAGAHKIWRRGTVLLVILYVALGVHGAMAQIVSIPFAGAAAGLPPGTGATVCSTALDTLGDGCPATQASLATGLGGVWSDAIGNIYIADYTNFRLRVIYRGGAALSTIITVNNPTLTGSPQVGYLYSIAGPGTGSLATPYYCAGATATSGIKGLDILADGCPAMNAYTKPEGGSVSLDGDIFYADHSHSTTDVIRVIYAGGAAAAKLIYTETGVSSPIVGYIYRIGGPNNAAQGFSGNGGLASSGTFNTVYGLVADSNLNMYVADTANNVVRRIDGTTGILTAFAGGSGAGCTTTTKSCTATYAGDNAVATSASLSAPYEVALDASGNVYIADTGNKRIRAVYIAGTLPGISNPVVGYIYTVAGGGSSTTNGTSALSLSLTTPRGVSFDAAGNMYVIDAGSSKIWRVDAQTSVATVIAGGGSSKTIGGYCNGTVGPVATDTVGDGCPAMQGTLNGPRGRLSFDSKDVAYISDPTNALVRSLTINERFPDTAVGNSSTAPLAYSAASSFVTPALTFTTQGSATSEFSATSDNCAALATQAASTVCTYVAKFTPVLPGRRVGKVQVASTTFAAPLNIGLDGKGLAPLLAVSPDVSISVGSPITKPTSVTANSVGGIYVSDASQGTVSGGAPGGTFTTLATGLSNPGQVAVDGAGNLYIADAGNNRVVEVTAAGVSSSVVTGISSPSGAVSTGRGIAYIADTGNNRVLRYDSGTVTQLPLSGLSGPAALALDADGVLYVADTGNKRIVSYNTMTGIQSTILVSATIQPSGLAVDAADDIYFSDTLSGSVYMLPSGSTVPIALVTNLTTPGGLSLDASGNLFFTDTSAGAIRELPQQTASLAFDRTNYGDQSAAQILTLTNVGNQLLTFNASSTYSGSGDTADFAISQGSTACGAGPIAIASSCTLSAQFTPVAVGPYTDVLSFPSNAANGGVTSATLTGTGVNLIRTTLSLTLTSPSSGNVSYGQNAIFTATVTPASNSTTLSGNLVVRVDGTTEQTPSVSGTSTQFTMSFSPGTHVISVTYSGDSVYSSSYNTYSLTITQQVTTTTLSYSASLQTGTPSITFTATAAGTISGVPTGTVTIYNGTTLLGTGTLSAQGVASFTTTTVTYPAYGFQVVYSGDTNYVTSTSAAITLTADFSALASPTTLAEQAGVATSSTITITPYFGYAGTITFSCSGMPVDAACRFSPQSINVLSGAAQTVTVQFFTNLAPTLSSQNQSGRTAVLVCIVAPLLLLGGIRQRRNMPRMIGLGVLLLTLLGGAASLVGCSEQNPLNATGSTSAGTSNVTMTAKDSSGVAHSVNYMFTVYTNQ